MIEPEDNEAALTVFKQSLAADEPVGGERNQSADSFGASGRGDHQLLGAYVQGDERAFESLVGKYFRMVSTVAARQTGDSHLAEDIAQSVFLILSRKARGFSTKTSIPGWLLRTTRFVCWDAIKMRRRREQNERELAAHLERQFAIKPKPNTMEVLLEEAIQALPPEQQAGIVARFFEGKDFQQIAEMFAISEDAARKRTSRCLASLQTFMTRRGAKVPLAALTGLLVAQQAQANTSPAVHSAIRALQAAWQAKGAASNAIALADRTLRRLRWRWVGQWSLRLGVPLLALIAGLLWILRSHPTVADRTEALGQAWGALDQQIAQHRQFLIQTPPNTPGYQATVQQGLDAISRESTHLTSALKPLLAAPDARNRLARFLTAELADSLKLDPAQRSALLSNIRNRLAAGATLNEAMKTLAQATQLEAAEIRAMLSPSQRQLFDQVYGADGVLLFSYAKAVALGTIGP